MNDLTAHAVAIDPITVEVIGSALSSITEEMGEALIRASYSTNIKERRDCSTALFDIHGNTLCQAEHIPMHLGSFIGADPPHTEAPPDGGDASRRRVLRQRCVRGRRDASARHRARRTDLRRWQHHRLGGQPGASRRLRRSRPCAHLPGRTAHPADPSLSRRRAAARRAGADPAELPGAARAPVRSACADGRQPARRAAHAGAVREIRPRDRPCCRRCAAGLRRAQDACRHRSRSPTAPIASPTATTARRSTASWTSSCDDHRRQATRCACISRVRRRCALVST